MPVMATLDPRHKSRTLYDGRDRAPARSYLKAIGFSDADLGRPIVGESYFFSYSRGDSPGISAVELIGSKGQLAMRGTSSDRKLFHLPRAVSCAADGAGDWREITLPPMNEAPH